MSEKESLYARGELNETLAHLIDACVLKYIDQSEFENLYTLIRQAEQALNGFMALSAGSALAHRNMVIKRFTKIKRIMTFRRMKKTTKNDKLSGPVYMYTCIPLYLYTASKEKIWQIVN